MAASDSAYPAAVRIDGDQHLNQLWGIPILGLAIRGLILIPHFIVLWVLGFLASLATLVTWIWILVGGRLPDWALSLFETTYRWAARVSAYWLLITGPYPPFSSGDDYPVDVAFARDQSINRLWGIPILGWAVRFLVLIPHLILLSLVGIAAYLGLFLSWIPILLQGRPAGWMVTIFGGYLRWSTRVTAYALFVTDRYPPFSLSD
jgi:hypothetical protein